MPLFVSLMLWNWSRRWKRECGDVGPWVKKQDWVRLIVARRGQPLRSANIIIRFFNKVAAVADIESRQCCCSFYQLHQVQHVFTIQSVCKAMRMFTYWLDPKANHKPSKYQGLGCLGSGCSLEGLDLPCCLSDYTMITARCVLLCYVYIVVKEHLRDLLRSWFSKFKLHCW